MARQPNSSFPPFKKGELEAALVNSRPEHQYPPVLNVDQAAELLGVPKSTIYDYSSRGRFSGCSRKMGKHLKFFRDRLLHKVFCEGL